MPVEGEYDVIVVGSGAAGGIACHVLANHGLNVLCLEAGRMIDPARDFHNHKWSYEWPYRGNGKPRKYGRLPQGMEWKIKEWTDHLYTIPQDDPYGLAPGSKFTWTRIRAVGGRTLLWGRNCDRFGRSISNLRVCRMGGAMTGQLATMMSLPTTIASKP